MRLDELRIGQRATITRVDEGSRVAQRLMTLGLLEGTKVALIRRALGGDPLEIDVMGYALSLRSSEARRVYVELQP